MADNIIQDENKNDAFNIINNSLQAVLSKESASVEEIARLNELTAQMNNLAARVDALAKRRTELELSYTINEQEPSDKYFKERDELLADCKKLDADRDAFLKIVKAFTVVIK